MSVLHLSAKHGRTLDDARAHLQMTVREVQSRLGPLVERVEWSTDRSAVKLYGAGLEVDIRVDAEQIHLDANLPLLARLVGSPLVSGLKRLVERDFPKRLT